MIITEDKKKKILREFVEYLEEGYDKQILTCEIFWEMDDYYRTRSTDITYITVKEVEDYLDYLGWDIIHYN